MLNILRRAADNPPTAVFGFNDHSALGGIIGLREAGFRVPEDVTVLSYGGCLDESLLQLSLPTVVEPLEEMARQACEMLLGQIEHKAYRKGPILVTGQFRPAQSSRPGGPRTQ
jgi:LacI family transcriptional regulator/LacI family repressor for deo operon, udp, cdd, tsx, nupC, and nupG